jgi:hypothetical protein
MARIRTIKPEFFTSEDIVSLSPLARLLYIALWCEADKEGRMVWKPSTFKLRYMPGDSCDIHALCKEIADNGLVVLYGNGYAYIPAFKSHQHINPRETASQLPEPDAKSTRQPRVGTRQPRDHDAQGGREGKGKEGKESLRVASGGGLFDLFWSAYPNKVAKDAARKAFDKRSPDADLVGLMVKAINVQRASEKWKKNNGQFIPNPATWLNGGQWQDGESVGLEWFKVAGFETDWEAENAKCYPHNANLFCDGRRIAEAA